MPKQVLEYYQHGLVLLLLLLILAGWLVREWAARPQNTVVILSPSTKSAQGGERRGDRLSLRLREDDSQVRK